MIETKIQNNISEKPLLFNTEMVVATLEDRKSHTRRVIKKLLGFGEITEFGESNTRGYDWHFRDKRMLWNDISTEKLMQCCPYGMPGDELWMRETFFPVDATYPCLFKADMPMHWEDSEGGGPITLEAKDYKWKASIFMPREFSRIQLKIKGIRVERIQDISESDCEKEGLKILQGGIKAEYICLWDRINFKRGFGWLENPWVWVIQFEVIK